MHPWRELRALRHLDVRWSDLGTDGPHGLIEGCRITLATGLTQVERRCTIMHELIHHERGIADGDGEREEIAVEREVAYRLIDLDALIRVARLRLSLHDAADELWVRPDLLQLRVESMSHPAERTRWRAVMSELSEGE